MSRVQQIYQAILEADQAGAEEYPTAPAQIPPAVIRLANEIGGDDMLAEAALDFVIEKKREATIAKIIALRGVEWYQAQMAQMERQSGG